MVEATCFLSGLDQLENVRAAALAAFPAAALNVVQPTRLAVEPETACEGIGRLQQRPKNPVEFLAAGGTAVAQPRLIFTGAQLAFENRDQDLRLAFDRQGRALEAMKAGYRDTLVMSVYSLSRDTAAKTVALAPEFLGRSSHPWGSTQIVEGLPSLDATVGIELVAAGP